MGKVEKPPMPVIKPVEKFFAVSNFISAFILSSGLGYLGSFI